MCSQDGAELPKLMTFDGESSESAADQVPPSVPRMSANPQAEEMATKFLQEYFRLYDGNDRAQLLDAYRDDAVMSMSMELPHQEIRRDYARDMNSLNKIKSDSRNLMWKTSEQARNKMLRKGKLNIVG